MSQDLTKDLNYDALVDSLLEKSLAGKIQWAETAEEDTFVAAVKGQQTFQVSAKFGGVHLRDNELEQDVVTKLKVRGFEGKTIIDCRETGQSSSLFELFSVAKRIALRIDERIDESLELLNSL